MYNVDDSCLCGEKTDDIVKEVLSRATNILIGNYIKIKNEKADKAKADKRQSQKVDKSAENRKIKKFKRQSSGQQ